MSKELLEKIKELSNKFSVIRDIFDLPKKEKKIADLEKVSAATDFWNDPQQAGKVMKELEEIKNETDEIKNIGHRIEEVSDLVDLSESENDWKDLDLEIKKLESDVNKLEFNTLLAGPYDRNDAIISIYSGAGGVDAQDWAEMLMRMYLKFAENNNFHAKMADQTRGQEAGIKNYYRNFWSVCIWISEERGGRPSAGATFAFQCR
jgi:peptide chain release factor 2